MDLQEILTKMTEPEKLIDPNEMALISSYISGFITDYTLQYDETKLAYSFQWEKIKYRNYEDSGHEDKPLSDKQTEIYMIRDPVTEKLNKIKRTLSELKRYRQDLNRRIEIIMGQHRRI